MASFNPGPPTHFQLAEEALSDATAAGEKAKAAPRPEVAGPYIRIQKTKLKEARIHALLAVAEKGLL